MCCTGLSTLYIQMVCQEVVFWIPHEYRMDTTNIKGLPTRHPQTHAKAKLQNSPRDDVDSPFTCLSHHSHPKLLKQHNKMTTIKHYELLEAGEQFVQSFLCQSHCFVSFLVCVWLCCLSLCIFQLLFFLSFLFLCFSFSFSFSITIFHCWLLFFISFMLISASIKWYFIIFLVIPLFCLEFYYFNRFIVFLSIGPLLDRCSLFYHSPHPIYRSSH